MRNDNTKLRIWRVGLITLIFLLGAAYLLVPLWEKPKEPEPLLPARDAGAAEVDWAEAITVALGDAYRGPWRMNKSEFHYVDDPTIAIAGDGTVAVVWADQRRKDIFFQLHGPDGKARSRLAEASGVAQVKEPVNVSRSPGIFSWLPRMVIVPDKTKDIYVLWQEIIFSGGTHGGEIFFARSTDGGRSFEAPLNLSNSLAGDGKGRLTSFRWDNGSLDLAVGATGEIYAVWTEYEGALRFSRSVDRGVSFSSPLHIAGAFKVPARAPSLATGPAAEVYLVWTIGENPAADIYFTQSQDGGRTFEEPQIVYQTGGHSDAPQIVVDKQRTVHLVFGESSAGPFQGYDVLYTRFQDNAFEKPKIISPPKNYESNSFHYPNIAMDNQSNLFALWNVFPDFRRAARGLGLTFSSDGGESFFFPLLVPGSAEPKFGESGSQQGLLMRKLAVDDAGGIAIVNSTFQENKESRIWLFRGTLRR